MKLFKQLRKYGSAIALGAAGLSGSAHAAIPTEVSTAITSAGTDGGGVAGLVFVAVVGIFAFTLMRKGLR